jgi:hypothetical protein
MRLCIGGQDGGAHVLTAGLEPGEQVFELLVVFQ